MTRKRNRLSRLSVPGFNNLYLYDESLSIHGTIKDRRSQLIIDEALKLHVDKLVLITSGNNGYSLATLANNTNIKVCCIVSKSAPQSIKETLAAVAYQVVEMNLSSKILRPEELITIVRESDDEVIWDVTNGYEEAYVSIIQDIAKEVTPTYIVCPIGSGGIYMGLLDGIRKYLPKTKLIGIGTRENYISAADKLSTPWSPYTKAIEMSESKGNIVFRLSEDEIKDTFVKYKHYANMEASSAVVFAALRMSTIVTSKDSIVLVNTGKLKK